MLREAGNVAATFAGHAHQVLATCQGRRCQSHVSVIWAEAYPIAWCALTACMAALSMPGDISSLLHIFDT